MTMKRLIYFLLGLLGVTTTSCRVEYGAPHVDFRLTARVVDEQGTPIQGILVRGNYGHFGANTGYSDYLGNIDAQGGYMSSCPDRLIFEDIDGELNGGEFEQQEVSLAGRVVQTENGSGAWYGGAFEAELGDVVMKRKDKDDAEPHGQTDENR